MALGPDQNPVQGGQDAQGANAPGPSAAALPPTQSAPAEQPAGHGAHIEADVRKSILNYFEDL